MTREIDQEVGIDTAIVTPESHKPGMEPQEIVISELQKLGIVNGTSLEAFKKAITSWTVRRNRLRPNMESISRVNECLEGDDIPGAILAASASIKEPSVHGSLNKTIRSLRAKIIAATSSEEEHIFVKGKPSTTFSLGGAAHALCEPIKACRDLNSLDNGKFIFEVCDGKVIGMREEPKFVPSQFDLKMNRERIKPNNEKNKTHPVGSIPNQESRHIKFEYPIDPPGDGQSRVDWAIEIFLHSFGKIKENFGFLPEKPFDVEQIFKDEKSLQVLMESLEAAHIIFGVDHGLDMVEWNGNKGILESKNAEEFPILDWMAIMRNTIDLVDGEHLGREEGVLIEIPEGDILISSGDGNGGKVSEKIRGNKIDIMRLRWKSGNNNSEDDLWKGKMSLETAVKFISGKFYSQESKYRKIGVVKGKIQETITMNFRNVRSLFKELYEIYGKRIFTDLEICIDDLKFPAGDGGWFQQFNPNFLPEKKHVEQVSGYLFKVMTQLFWVKKRLENQEGFQLGELIRPDDMEKINSIENFPIDVNEVAKFILDYDLCDRIKGRLLYQFPGTEVCKTVSLEPDLDEIIRRGNKIFDVASKLDQRKTLHLLQTIKGIYKLEIENLTIVEKKVKTLPEEMKSLCVENDGGIFLCIEKISNLLKEKMAEGNLNVEQMVSFVDKDMRVIWFGDFIDDISSLRIAVDRNGKYSISYDYEEKSVHFGGKLLSSVRMRGVSEKVENLITLFSEDVWDAIKNGLGVSELPSLKNLTIHIDNKDWIICPDGNLERKISEKPVICLWNPMGNGGWYLDTDLLEEAIENDASHRDTWGFHKLAELVNRKYKGEAQVLCPLPFHSNINQSSMAATWYGEKGVHHHIYCHRCEESTNLAPTLGMEHSIVFEPVATGKTIHDFRPVSIERQKTFEATLKVVSTIEKYSKIATRYLIEERGLGPEDIGEYGYIPMEIVRALSRLVESDGFRELRKRDSRVGFDSIGNALRIYSIQDPIGAAESAVNDVIELLKFVEPYEREKLFSILTVANLTEMHRRGVIETRSEKHKTDEIRARLGGRIILPTYFINPLKSGIDAFVRSNFIARGIVLEGQQLFEGNHQHKARIRQGKKIVRNGERLLDTPTGFWARDWQSLIMNVDVKKEIIVFEGPMDVGSFGRIRPDYKDTGFSNVGYNYHFLFPFLRFLGMAGDGDSSGQGFRMGIKRIFFANDWDRTGTLKFQDRKEKLKVVFPEVEVLPIHDLLPNDILSIVPPYDPKLLNAEDQTLRGKKWDMNTLINAEAEDDPVLKPIRDKYAYKP